jgi:hypothetical protein
VSVPGAGGPVVFAGASVALDRPDGSRSEALTDTGGRVTFDGIGVSRGTFSFTVATPGYVAVTSANMSQVGDWNVTLAPFGDNTSLVDVTGTVVGKSNADHFVFVSAAEPSSVSFEGVGPVYTIRVAPAVGFTAVVAEGWYGPAPSSPQGSAFEFLSWAGYAICPAGGASVVDLILPGAPPTSLAADVLTGYPLMPLKGSGTLRVPPSMHGAGGGLRVSSQESSGSAFQGAATLVALAPNNVDLHYESEYVLVAGGRAPITTYWVTRADAYSYAYRLTGPTEDVDFLDPPVLASPQMLYGGLPVQNVQPGLELSVNIATDDSSVVWRIFNQGMPSDELRMPKLPSSIDPRIVLGTGSVTARAYECRLDPSTNRCTELAASASAELVSP